MSDPKKYCVHERLMRVHFNDVRNACLLQGGEQYFYLMIKGVCFRALWKLIVHWSKQTQTCTVNEQM